VQEYIWEGRGTNGCVYSDELLYLGAPLFVGGGFSSGFCDSGVAGGVCMAGWVSCCWDIVRASCIPRPIQRAILLGAYDSCCNILSLSNRL